MIHTHMWLCYHINIRLNYMNNVLLYVLFLCVSAHDYCVLLSLIRVWYLMWFLCVTAHDSCAVSHRNHIQHHTRITLCNTQESSAVSHRNHYCAWLLFVMKCDYAHDCCVLWSVITVHNCCVLQSVIVAVFYLVYEIAVHDCLNRVTITVYLDVVTN